MLRRRVAVAMSAPLLVRVCPPTYIGFSPATRPGSICLGLPPVGGVLEVLAARAHLPMPAARGLLWCARPGQGAGFGESMPEWCDRKAIVFPGLEPADDVTGPVEAELDEVASGENR